MQQFPLPLADFRPARRLQDALVEALGRRVAGLVRPHAKLNRQPEPPPLGLAVMEEKEPRRQSRQRRRRAQRIRREGRARVCSGDTLRSRR